MAIVKKQKCHLRQIGLSDSDEDGEEGQDNLASPNGGGGGRRRRNKDKAAPDMGSRCARRAGLPACLAALAPESVILRLRAPVLYGTDRMG